MRHRLVDLHPLALDEGIRVGVVDVGVVSPSTPGSPASGRPRTPASCRRARRRCPIAPLTAQARPIRGSPVSMPSTRTRPASRMRSSAAPAEQVPHRRRHDGAAPVGDDGHLAARGSWSVSVPRPASHPSTRGRLSGSRGSWPLTTSNQRAVSRTDRARQPTIDRQVAVVGVGRHRHSPERRLQPDQAAEAGRDADRAAAVAARRQRDDAAGDRRRRTAGRAARRAVELPRVARHAVQHGAGDVDAAELGRRGLAGEHGAAEVADALHHASTWRWRSGRASGTDARLWRPPGDLVELLDADRHPTERQRRRRRRRRRSWRAPGRGGRTRSAGWRRWRRRPPRAPRPANAHRAERLDERAGVPWPWCVPHRSEGSRGAARGRNGTGSPALTGAYDRRRWTPARSSVWSRPTTGSAGSCR